MHVRKFRNGFIVFVRKSIKNKNSAERGGAFSPFLCYDTVFCTSEGMCTIWAVSLRHAAGDTIARPTLLMDKCGEAQL